MRSSASRSCSDRSRIGLASSTRPADPRVSPQPRRTRASAGRAPCASRIEAASAKSASAGSISPRTGGRLGPLAEDARLAELVADGAGRRERLVPVAVLGLAEGGDAAAQPRLERGAPDHPIDDQRDVAAALERVPRLGEAALPVVDVAQDPGARDDARGRAGLLGTVHAVLGERDRLVEVARGQSAPAIPRSGRRAGRSGRPSPRARSRCWTASSAFVEFAQGGVADGEGAARERGADEVDAAPGAGRPPRAPPRPRERPGEDLAHADERQRQRAERGIVERRRRSPPAGRASACTGGSMPSSPPWIRPSARNSGPGQELEVAERLGRGHDGLEVADELLGRAEA